MFDGDGKGRKASWPPEERRQQILNGTFFLGNHVLSVPPRHRP